MRALLLALLLAPAAHAGETASFLELPVGARAVALGGAGTALADDASALYWNPAGLAALERRDALFSHSELGETTRLDFGGFAAPALGGVAGGAFTYLSHGSISGRDAMGRPTGSYGASDAALAGSYARKLGETSAGVSLKYLRSHIAEAEAQSVAVDVGVSAKRGEFTGAAALRNLGPGLRFADQTNDLPLAAAGGVAWKRSTLTLALDYEYRPRVGQNDAGAGAEWEAKPGVFLRGGYSTKGAIGGGSGLDAAKGIAFGLGIKLGSFRVDYAIKPTGELGRAHRFDVGARF
jgi:hypothetical protein